MATQQPSKYSGNSLPFASALLLTDEEQNAAVDRIALRGAGMQRVRLATSGVETARILAEKVSKVLLEDTELIVCLPMLGDMSAVQFAELVRAHPLLAHIPLLAVTPEQGQETLLRQSGFNGVLLRPFTTTALINQIHTIALDAKTAHADLLKSLEITPGIPSHEAFDKLLLTSIPPDRDSMNGDEAFRHGIRLMRAHQWEKSLPFLQKAAQEGSMQGDAHMALAAFWQASGDSDKQHEHLLDAFNQYMASDSWPKAAKPVRRLATEFSNKPSPLLKEIERRARQNQPHVMTDLVAMAPDIVQDNVLLESMLKGARASAHPAETISGLLETFQKNGMSYFAQSLAGQPELKAEPRQKRSWFERETPKPKKMETLLDIAAPEKDLKNESAAQADARAPTRKGIPLAADPKGPAIALLGDSGDDSTLQPSIFGDAGAMIRGTLRLYKRGK